MPQAQRISIPQRRAELKLTGLHMLNSACPMRDVLDRVGDQWSLLVLFHLREHMCRFGELKAEIGDISPRVLTLTVRRLEQDGLVSRKVYPTVPPKVEYTLTPLGRSLTTTMQGLVEWAERNHSRIRTARNRYAQRAKAAA